MLILLDDKTLETPLPYMPVGPIDLVMSPDVCCHQPLHPSAQFFRLLRPHDHVEVIGHQAVGKNLDRVESSAQPQEIREGLEVFVLVENSPVPVPTVVDVVDKSISKGSLDARHGN